MNQSDEIIQKALAEKASTLGECLGGEVLFIRAPMESGIESVVRESVEVLSGEREKLIVVLETGGGSIEVVERLNIVFREHFHSVVFIVPNQAYSAGTVLALSGDDIYMDYYSVLGPIDPQVRGADGRLVPGIGYLEKYNELITKSQTGTLSPAELHFLLNKFDSAELFALERAKAHSVELIEKWLSKYKFKNWKETETNKNPVTDSDRKKRAKEIAEYLGDPKVWNSHGRGIDIKTLESDDIKLQIENFGEDENLNHAIRDYYDVLIDYCNYVGVEYVIHTRHRFLPLGG